MTLGRHSGVRINTGFRGAEGEEGVDAIIVLIVIIQLKSAS